MRISSTRNPVVKYVRSLERARARRDEGVYLVEGLRLVDEAIRSGQRAVLAFYDPDALSGADGGDALQRLLPGWAEQFYEVDSRVLSAMAQTESPAGVLAVMRLPAESEVPATARLGVVLDSLADPGNVGTIIRTADALGAHFVAGTPDTADFFSPKVVRAGMGAHFRLPLYPDRSWQQLRALLGEAVVMASAAGKGSSADAVDWPRTAVLVVGNEARGLSPQAESEVSQYVHIPMRPQAESLNASVAAGILIYEAARGMGLTGR